MSRFQSDVPNVQFRRPPEAPVFEPTVEEFRDPLSYINKIKPIAEKSGICRIKPPSDWQPPFAVDITNFKFVPRLQRLNELEAMTRVKLNFLDRIAAFWELQGVQVKLPIWDGKLIDLYTLHKIVRHEGGWYCISREKLWGQVARKMRIINDRGASTVLKLTYEKLLISYDAYLDNLEKKKLAGEIEKVIGTNLFCKACSFDENDHNKIMTCASCSDSYHKLCLKTPPVIGLISMWRCSKCAAEEVARYSEPYGFDESNKEYSLVEFGEMADKFKANYFKRPAHTVPLKKVEEEFWKVISSLDESVSVEYGSDLHCVDRGSGFPTKDSINPNLENPDIIKYVNSPWNLNNFPVLEGSVFNYIAGKISGVKSPWMYVGMCFAAFCWHIEDHWSYSINYLHWGEPKTWYGVPGSYADEFEDAMKKAAPELFQMQPDLLHQLTTMLNPTALMDKGVPVYRADQHAGEFVITFPRAYHSGFNQGYNCAEAVNFAPADWLILGRECVNSYASIHRNCVFSHDELICKLGGDAEHIDPRIAAAAYYDMLQMVTTESKLRKEILMWGVKKSIKQDFEEIPDEHRQCHYCKTICYMSSIVCRCCEFSDKMVCSKHYRHLCTSCKPELYTLKYKYTLNEMPIFLQKLKIKAQTFDCWIRGMRKVIDSEHLENVDRNYLRSLLNEAKDKNYPESIIEPLLNTLSKFQQPCLESTIETIVID